MALWERRGDSLAMLRESFEQEVLLKANFEI